MVVSNAMNPQKARRVPSLHRATLSGWYTESCSASLHLWQSDLTWIISWPDYSGYEAWLDQCMGLILSSSGWPITACRQDLKHIFISHFDWFGSQFPRLAQRPLCHLPLVYQEAPSFQDMMSSMLTSLLRSHCSIWDLEPSTCYPSKEPIHLLPQ